VISPEEQEYTLPQEAFQLRHEIMDNPSAPEHLQQDKADSPHVSGNEAEVTCLTPIESFSLISISQPLFSPHLPASFFCPIVREMLSFYAEQGDVQMAVSVLIVLGERIRKEVDDLTQVGPDWCLMTALESFIGQELKMFCVGRGVNANNLVSFVFITY